MDNIVENVETPVEGQEQVKTFTQEEVNKMLQAEADRRVSAALKKQQAKFKEQMEGIITTSVCPNTIDEAPDAYKDTNEIVSLIQDTCEILYFIKPIINLKAKDSWILN